VLTLAVLEQVGVLRGDRIEHGSILGADSVASIARLGLCVVTQPGFVLTRGDRFLRDVSVASHPDLWRLGSLLAAGVAVAGSTDAPYGDPDPWLSLRAAVNRTTLEGRFVGADEGVDPRVALQLFTGYGADPARQRRVAVGEPADLCVVEPGTAGYGTGPGPEIWATFVAGRLVYTAP
jgi:predicted amidohydrolase YtcJ